MRRNGARRLTRYCRSSSSRVADSTGPREITPALWTSTSTPAPPERISRPADSSSSSRATSATSGLERPDPPPASPAIDSNPSRPLPIAHTSAPARTNATARAWPIPLLAPVTTQILPSRLIATRRPVRRAIRPRQGPVRRLQCQRIRFLHRSAISSSERSPYALIQRPQQRELPGARIGPAEPPIEPALPQLRLSLGRHVEVQAIAREDIEDRQRCLHRLLETLGTNQLEVVRGRVVLRKLALERTGQTADGKIESG